MLMVGDSDIVAKDIGIPALREKGTVMELMRVTVSFLTDSNKPFIVVTYNIKDKQILIFRFTQFMWTVSAVCLLCTL